MPTPIDDDYLYPFAAIWDTGGDVVNSVMWFRTLADARDKAERVVKDGAVAAFVVKQIPKRGACRSNNVVWGDR